MSVQNPHDQFFRESFRKPEIIHNFLEEYLLPELRSQLDLDSLKMEPDNYVDELRTHQTDLLYQVELVSGGSAYLYFLFEHKSYPEEQVALQLLRYLVQIWHEQPKKRGEKLRPIIPLVIYHGAQKWNVKGDFQALFDTLPVSVVPHIPQFHYQLFDFSYRSDIEIRGEIWLRVCLLILQAIFAPDLREQLPSLVNLMFELQDKQTGLEYIYTILYYLSIATDKVDLDTMQQTLSAHSQQGDQVMATIAQTLRAQGFQQGFGVGEKQGEKQALHNIARKLLQLHDVVTVSELTGLTIEEVRGIVENRPK